MTPDRIHAITGWFMFTSWAAIDYWRFGMTVDLTGVLTGALSLALAIMFATGRR